MNISFALTTPQFRARMKDVTRRLGWKNLKPGQVLTACEKCQGLKKGEHPVVLGRIRVKDVRREQLSRLTMHAEAKALDCVVTDAYKRGEAVEECRREGFPNLTPQQFVRMFCEHNQCDSATIVTRIEFEYL